MEEKLQKQWEELKRLFCDTEYVLTYSQMIIFKKQYYVFLQYRNILDIREELDSISLTTFPEFYNDVIATTDSFLPLEKNKNPEDKEIFVKNWEKKHKKRFPRELPNEAEKIYLFNHMTGTRKNDPLWTIILKLLFFLTCLNIPASHIEDFDSSFYDPENLFNTEFVTYIHIYNERVIKLFLNEQNRVLQQELKNQFELVFNENLQSIGALCFSKIRRLGARKIRDSQNSELRRLLQNKKHREIVPKPYLTIIHFKYTNLMYTENYLTDIVFHKNYERNFLGDIEKAKRYLVSIGTIENYLRYNENGIFSSSWKISKIKKVNKSDNFTN